VTPLRRVAFRLRAAFHLAHAVWAGADWDAAAGPVPADHATATPARAARPTGIVERFGRDQLSGWITVEPSAGPVTVELFLNRRRVATTVALVRADGPRRNGWGDIRHFEFTLADLWRFVRPSDRLSVRVGSTLLPINGRGMFRRPGRDAAASPEDLAAALADGQLFDETGHLPDA
jgi:hypothetical protein